MLLKRKMSVIALLITTAAGPVSALTAEEVIAQLKSEGYTDIEVEKTLLGRTKIEATKGNTEYEIVLSKSGEVLREEEETHGDDHDDDHDDDEHDDEHDR